MPYFLFDLRQRIRACRRHVLGGDTGDASGNLGLPRILFVFVCKQQGLRGQHRDEGDDMPGTKTFVAGSKHWARR